VLSLVAGTLLWRRAPVGRTTAMLGMVAAFSLTIIGLEIGLRFDRSAIGTLRRMAGAVSVLTLAMMAGCAALGVLLSLFAGVATVDAYLMTTPGAINAALAAAVSLKGVDLTLVTLAQVVRLAMVIVAPGLIRRTART
jgi:uncharacterized membrane protein AbrB (regulator of aidB expression)